MSTHACTALHHLVRAAAACVLAAALPASAQPIVLGSNSLNMFRDTRGANDVGISQGDVLQYGANIVGGSSGVSLSARYGPTGFSDPAAICVPLTVNANFCANTTPFNAGRLAEPWTLRFTRGADALEVAAPLLGVGAANAVPFPSSVTLSGSGLTPRISWQVPGGFTPDGFRLQIFDKNLRLANGQADIVHSVAVASNATFYDIPATFSSGLSLVERGNYTINFQLIETRGNVPFTNNNSQILRRSNSFFAFTPLSAADPPSVALPTVVDGVYNFRIDSVGPNVTFIDPFVAVGYDYATGEGDPNFASVLLPDVGDGQYTLSFTDANGAQSVGLAQGVQYFFGAGGVSSFRVSGIETSAALDPTDVTAFVTGLSFVANGSFTGTMTPITQFVAEVPEPASYGLAALGLALVGAAARRRRAGSMRGRGPGGHLGA